MLLEMIFRVALRPLQFVNGRLRLNSGRESAQWSGSILPERKWLFLFVNNPSGAKSIVSLMMKLRHLSRCSTFGKCLQLCSQAMGVSSIKKIYKGCEPALQRILMTGAPLPETMAHTSSYLHPIASTNLWKTSAREKAVYRNMTSHIVGKISMDKKNNKLAMSSLTEVCGQPSRRSINCQHSRVTHITAFYSPFTFLTSERSWKTCAWPKN